MCIAVQRVQFIAVCAEFKLLKLNPVMQSINKVDFLNERTGSLGRFFAPARAEYGASLQSLSFLVLPLDEIPVEIHFLRSFPSAAPDVGQNIKFSAFLV